MDKSARRKPKKQKNHLKKRFFIFATLALILVVGSYFSERLCPYDPYEQNLSIAKASPSLAHPFGTDRYGRDMLSRVIVGSKTSIYSTLLLVVGITVIGTIVGIICGWNGKKLDTILMRISDIFLAFPGLVFALAVAAVMGGGVQNAAYSPWGDQLAEICKDCQKSDIGTERKPLYAGGNLIWMQYRKTDFETYSAEYHRTDPCDCHAGYRNDDDGACRPVVSGTWCKTAGCGVGKYDE